MNRKAFTILASFALICCVAMPRIAHADEMSTVQQQIATCEKNAALNSRAAVQKRMAAAQGVYGGAAQLDVAMYNCVDQIEAAIDMLDKLLPTENSPPVKPFTAIVKQIAWSLAIQMLTVACQTVVKDIKQVELWALSQFNHLCLPLPKLFSLGIGGLHLPMAQCHGANLFGPMLGIPSTTGSGATSWKMWSITAH